MREVIRFDSDYSQKMLNRDIYDCERILENSKEAYDDLKGCMEDKGWQKIRNISEPARDVAARTYLQNDK